MRVIGRPSGWKLIAASKSCQFAMPVPHCIPWAWAVASTGDMVLKSMACVVAGRYSSGADAKLVVNGLKFINVVSWIN